MTAQDGGTRLLKGSEAEDSRYWCMGWRSMERVAALPLSNAGYSAVMSTVATFSEGKSS